MNHSHAEVYTLPMRIAVLNLQSGIGITSYPQYVSRGWAYVFPHGGHYVREAGDMLKRENVDLALAVEVEEHGLRSGFLSQAKILREHSQMSEHVFFTTRIVGRMVHEGSAILSRFPLSGMHTYPLPSRKIPRLLGESTIEVQDTQVHILVAHLGLRREFRHKQIAKIAEILRERTGPIILGGDFNERDHEAFAPLRALFPHLVTHPTFPSWNPKFPLGVLFLSEHFVAPHAYTPEGSLFSDHAPFIVETDFRAGPQI